MMNQTERLAELERELEQLKKQLPKHGLKPSTLARIDDLEEEIDALKAQVEQEA
jgi:polyhydroxyalkanoate synthesis regulator phasin